MSRQERRHIRRPIRRHRTWQNTGNRRWPPRWTQCWHKRRVPRWDLAPYSARRQSRSQSGVKRWGCRGLQGRQDCGRSRWSDRRYVRWNTSRRMSRRQCRRPCGIPRRAQSRRACRRRRAWRRRKARREGRRQSRRYARRPCRRRRGRWCVCGRRDCRLEIPHRWRHGSRVAPNTHIDVCPLVPRYWLRQLGIAPNPNIDISSGGRLRWSCRHRRTNVHIDYHRGWPRGRLISRCHSYDHMLR